LIAVDIHASRFHGGDPGKLTFAQFEANQDFSPTPYNENWVDRSRATPHWLRRHLGRVLILSEGRAAAALPAAPPFSYQISGLQIFCLLFNGGAC
jgi:hypothetical protein